MSQKNINKAMGDIDEAASKSQIPGAQKDPGVILGSIDHANFGGINSILEIPPEASGTQVSYVDNSFNDDVAQYRKGEPDNVAELNRVRNQAFSMVDETQDNTNPPFTGRQDSDPKGG